MGHTFIIKKYDHIYSVSLLDKMLPDEARLYQWWHVINYAGYVILLWIDRPLNPQDLTIDVGAMR